MWVMDEYANRPRRDVWFSPPTAPTRAPEEKINKYGAGFSVFSLVNINSSGNSFCHVARVKQIGHERPAITLGNQKCIGAAPALVIKPTSIRDFGMLVNETGVFIQTPPPRRKIEPRTWARKYLIADSYSLFELDCIINGMNANRFNSIPAYIEIQFVADRAIIVPSIIVAMKNVCESFR